MKRRWRWTRRKRERWIRWRAAGLEREGDQEGAKQRAREREMCGENTRGRREREGGKEGRRREREIEGERERAKEWDREREGALQNSRLTKRNTRLDLPLGLARPPLSIPHMEGPEKKGWKAGRLADWWEMGKWRHGTDGGREGTDTTRDGRCRDVE